MMEHLLQRLGITHLYATPYHPQTNGQIERFNSTMNAKIAALSDQYQSDWDDKLPFVIFNYNTSYHSTTKTIPFELMYGHSPVPTIRSTKPNCFPPTAISLCSEHRPIHIISSQRCKNQYYSCTTPAQI